MATTWQHMAIARPKIATGPKLLRRAGCTESKTMTFTEQFSDNSGKLRKNENMERKNLNLRMMGFPRIFTRRNLALRKPKKSHQKLKL